MKTKFSKRVLSILLVVLLCLSCITIGMVSASAAMDLYVRGDFNGWGTSDTWKMTTTDGITYKATVPVTAGTNGYKVATSDWSYEIGGSGGANLTLTVDYDSMVTFTANTSSKTVTTSATQQNTILSNKLNTILRCYWSNHANAVLVQEANNTLSFHDYSTDDMTDLAYHWNVTSTEDGKGVYVQNADTNNYLAVANGAFAFTNEPFAWDAKFVKGNIVLMDEGKSINIEDWKNGVQLTQVPANYESAQWKFFYESLNYTVEPDRIVGTGYDAVAKDGTTITSNATGTPSTWTLSEDVSKYPSITATDSPLLEAVYNLSMEEFIKNQYNDPQVGTALKTGDLWNKVWTRDSAYSNLLSMSWLEPEIADNCNRKKVHTDTNTGVAVFEQDTGTGGSYPVSTDKIILLSSVWETYLADGNTENLAYFYDVAYNTMMQDLHVAMDPNTGLFKGETGGIDWRDQTYPDWMSSKWSSGMVDIAEGRSAVVNATYVHAYEIMARMADILGKGQDAIDFWTKAATELEKAMSDQLWNESLGIYSSWMYPEYMGNALSGKGDVLGNGYALWFDVGTDEQIQSIMDNYPLVNYGAPTTYPQKMGNGEHAQRYYHNRGIWPGWQVMMMVGANLQGNEAMAEEIFDSNIHCAASYLSNYEVVNYETGEGIHSRKQLWSVAGTLAGYYRLIFGMNYTEDGITFNPTVQDWVKGSVTLNDFAYRNAKLNITVNGTGDKVEKFVVNGEEKDITTYVLPTTAEGAYTIEITLAGNEGEDTFKQGDQYLEICPSMPTMRLSGNTLSWTPVSGLTYKLWTGKEYIDVTGVSSYKIDTTVYGSYSLLSIAESGIESEYSEPIVVSPDRITVEAEDASLKSTKYINGGYVIDKLDDCATIQFIVDVPKTGRYLLHSIYNNPGAGQDGLSCGIRSIYVDDKDHGTMVFPEVYAEYKNQESSHVAMDLEAGKHIIKVIYETENPYDQNMGWYVQYDIPSDKNDYVSGLEFKNTVEFDKFHLDYVSAVESGYEALPDDTTLPETPVEEVSGVKKLYYNNVNSKWNEVHLYGWGGSGLNGSTVALTKIEGTNMWYCELETAIPYGEKCIIFKDTAGGNSWVNQTSDLEIPEGMNCYTTPVWGSSAWSFYEEQEPTSSKPTETEPPTESQPTSSDPTESSSETEATEPSSETEATEPSSETEATEPSTETQPQPTQAPKLTVKNTKLKAGQTTKATVSNANGKKVTYKSSKPKLVKIDSKGNITALNKGKSVITVKVGTKTLKKTITVTTAPQVKQGKTVLKNNKTITIGKNKSVKLTLTGKAAKIATNVKSANKNVAKITTKKNTVTIKAGKLKGKTTKVTITINGVKKYTYKIKVK